MSMLAMLSSGAGWWLMWPESTVRAFTSALNEQGYKAHEFTGTLDQQFYFGDPRFVDRTIQDIVLGRQVFWFDGIAPPLLAERGRVYWIDSPPDMHPMQWQAKRVSRDSFGALRERCWAPHRLIFSSLHPYRIGDSNRQVFSASRRRMERLDH